MRVRPVHSTTIPFPQLENNVGLSDIDHLRKLVGQVARKTFAILTDTFYTIFVKPVGAFFQLNHVVVNMYQDANFCSYIRTSTAPVKTFTNPDPNLLHFPLTSNLNSRLIASTTENEEDFLAACWVMQAIHDTVTDPDMRRLLSGEVLAKVIAYRELREGQTIPIPSLDSDGKPCRLTYRVDRRFNLWKDIPAFGLVPIDHPEAAPILLFRGTSFSLSSKGGPASIASNFDPAGSGWVPFQNNKQQLKEWLVASTKQTKARVIGNGLGGSIASYAAIAFADFINKKSTEPSYSFNPIGVKEELGLLWNDLPTSIRPKLEVYITQGDVIPKFGWLFGNVYEVQVERRLYPMAAHRHLSFFRPHVKIFAVDVEKENQSKSRKMCQKWQKFHLRVVHKAFQLLLLGILYPISRFTNGVTNEGWLSAALNTTFVVRGVLGFI